MSNDNLVKFPVEKLGDKAGLIQYVRDLLADLESGAATGIGVIRLAGDGYGIRTAWGFVADGKPQTMRLHSGASTLAYRLQKTMNGEDD